MSAFHQKFGDEEQRRSTRAHLTRYGLEKRDLRRLGSALSTIEELSGSIELALTMVPRVNAPAAVPDVCRALRHLINGARS